MTRCFLTCVLGLLTIACASGGATSTARAPMPAPQVTAAVVAVVPAGRDLVEDRTFTSQALGRPTTFRVVLPDGYTTTLRRYPTLYLLHGLTGTYSDWESRTDLFRHARAHDFIIVMPDGQDSWYTDSQGVPVHLQRRRQLQRGRGCGESGLQPRPQREARVRVPRGAGRAHWGYWDRQLPWLLRAAARHIVRAE